MPHSSGGGSSGGGFHSGGSFHSSSNGSNNYVRHTYSRTPFIGASCYVYYHHHRPATIYSNDKPSKSLIGSWISLLVMIALLIGPLLFIFFTSYHVPKKLNTNYDTEIVITDNIGVLSSKEENTLKQTFFSFFDETGITPAFMSTDDYSYDLETYAYNNYVKNFHDEKHWLIVYYQGPRNNWQFEGMQGNDTDTILSKNVTTNFNKTLYNNLSSGVSVSSSLIDSFNIITPHIMDSYFYMEGELITFSIIWTTMLSIIVILAIKDLINKYKLKNAILVNDQDNLVLRRCPYCNSEYYLNTIKTCPKCHNPLPFEGSFHMPDNENDNNQ